MPETTANLIAPDFLALTIGIVVFFVGVLITQRVSFLRTYNIPEPVTGGFVAALAFWAVYEVFGLEIGFEMTTRDRLLVIFLASVGVNARLAGHVLEDHAALDAGRRRGLAARHRCRASGRRGSLHSFGGLPGPWPRLSGGGPVWRVHWAVARLDFHRHRLHVGDHPKFRAGTLHNPTFRFRLIR